jgi:hypothetical protein
MPVIRFGGYCLPELLLQKVNSNPIVEARREVYHESESV